MSVAIEQRPAAQSRVKSILELADMTGRVAVITGGAGHIGSVMAEGLAELGANVVVLDRDPDACQEKCSRLREVGRGEPLALAADLAIEAETRGVCDRVVQEYGRLDVLVNCAAFVGTSNLGGWVTSFENQSADSWRKALELNLTVPFLLTQSCADALAKSGHGSVINIGSTYGVVGVDMRLYEGTSMGNPAAYAASKGGLIQLTRWLATVLAPAVRVNSITPGGVYRQQHPAFVSRYVDRTPLKRMATEQDYKGAAAYLASDLSAYVTGQNLVVDGGWTAW
jgi:NAD(P)-dependent dehydrogenase (short-subunit alcohol dehydrogenase family)